MTKIKNNFNEKIIYKSKKVVYNVKNKKQRRKFRMGIAALVLGIIAFGIAVTFVLAPLGVVLAVIGLILGIVDTVKKGKTGEKKAISIAGMILCAVMFITLIAESFFILVIGVATYSTISDYDTNRITESMESAAVESFNAKFSSYEGTGSGARVKSLLSTISTSNSYNEHQVEVNYNGLLEDPYSLRQEIETMQQYTITFYEDIDGYINRVYIMPNYDKTTNNNVTNNQIITNQISNTTNLL